MSIFNLVELNIWNGSVHMLVSNPALKLDIVKLAHGNSFYNLTVQRTTPADDSFQVFYYTARCDRRQDTYVVITEQSYQLDYALESSTLLGGVSILISGDARLLRTFCFGTKFSLVFRSD